LLPDKKLLQRLGSTADREAKDRHEALVALAAIIPQLTIPKAETVRHPMRIGIPRELDEALERKQIETGQTALVLLLQSTKEYFRRQESDTAETTPSSQADAVAPEQSFQVAKRKPGRPRKSEAVPQAVEKPRR